ncbi:GNAT family acetyltransferase [Xanthobacter agilis]|uniref:Ribosomal protein S18 acetylase RimI-like enzyme n=2 Tax=Xanthobacter agilis TaxID=47492 RepID=A0ABU0LKD0_XANAG|nr:ribosomal protein S18 acetylase RimI-like enzyme [Xanthobacter agilis]
MNPAMSPATSPAFRDLDLVIGHLEEADIPALVDLWARAGLIRPWNDPHADIALARRGPHSTILAMKAGPTLLGAVMVGHDGHRGWVYYLAIDPDHQRQGLGSLILSAAQDWLRARAVPKLMLMVRPDNADVRAFYHAEGFIEEPRIVFSKRLDDKRIDDEQNT